MAVDSHLSSPLGPSACEKDAKALLFIEEMTRNADSVQEKVLAEILSRNAETEYLKRFQLGGATDRDTFKSKIPVLTYEDLQPEIHRISNGDRSPILYAHLDNIDLLIRGSDMKFSKIGMMKFTTTVVVVMMMMMMMLLMIGLASAAVKIDVNNSLLNSSSNTPEPQTAAVKMTHAPIPDSNVSTGSYFPLPH